MKKTIPKYFFLTIFLLFSFISYAQFSGDTTELKLIQPGKIWYISYTDHSLKTTAQIIYRIANDTLINNMTFYKVYRKPYNKSREDYYGLVRTEEAYLQLITNNDTTIYYQFPISHHDTIEYCWQVVDIQKIKLNNNIKANKYALKNIEHGTKATWIEGIGDLDGIFYPPLKFLDQSCLPYKITFLVSDIQSNEFIDSVYLNNKLLFKRSMLEE